MKRVLLVALAASFLAPHALAGGSAAGEVAWQLGPLPLVREPGSVSQLALIASSPWTCTGGGAFNVYSASGTHTVTWRSTTWASPNATLTIEAPVTRTFPWGAFNIGPSGCANSAAQASAAAHAQASAAANTLVAMQGPATAHLRAPGLAVFAHGPAEFRPGWDVGFVGAAEACAAGACVPLVGTLSAAGGG